MSRCYTQITLADRRRLHQLIALKASVNEMARLLNVKGISGVSIGAGAS